MITQERVQPATSERRPSARSGKAPSGFGLGDVLDLPVGPTHALQQGARPYVEGAYVSAAEWQRLLGDQLSLVEQERQRIAADLHDGLGQSLCLLSRSLGQLKTVVAGHTEGVLSGQLTDTLNQISRSVDGMLSDLRRTAMNLRPSVLDDLGLLPALSWLMRDVETSCPGLQIERRIQVTEADVPDALKTAIFRIVQEALTNALKHAGARKLAVCLKKRYDRLFLCICDDGRGFELPSVEDARRAGGGVGLRSMQARAQSSGGQLSVQSAPERGTRIEVRWAGIYRPVAKGQA